MPTARCVMLGVGLLVALAGCGGRTGATAVPDAPSGASATVAGATAGASDGTGSMQELAGPVDGATEVVESPDFPGGSDGIAYLVRVEAGRHAGFDRVVWEFDGPAPSYRVGYVQPPVTEDGSGRPVPVAGDAVLHVIFSLASGVDLSGSEPAPVYDGPLRLSGADAGTTSVAEVVQTGDFEATLSWAVGVTTVAPFSVRELSDPTRVVIDIATV